MKNYIISLVVVFTSCDVPLCRSVCGMDYVGISNGRTGVPWTCSDFQTAEDKALRLFKGVRDHRFLSEDLMCRKLKNYTIMSNPQTKWLDPYGRLNANGDVIEIAGLTFCPSRTIEANSNYPHKGSLMHEMAHAIQECVPIQIEDPTTDVDHKNWKKDGIFDAIDRWESE